jgi:hypothetical protein
MKVIKIKELDLVNAIENVLNEQQSGNKCEYKNWTNGDGINKPKITVQQSENGVIGTYIGPETGFCIQHSKGSTKDTLHQLAGVVSVTVSPLLKTLYNQGKFVRPSLKDISMLKDDNFFKISIPFMSTTEDNAITNFNERGGWGHDAAQPIAAFMGTIEGNPKKYGLIEKETKTASGGNSANIIEHWVSFRDFETFPIKTQPKTEFPKPPQKPESPAQQPAPVQSQTQDIASLVELSENASTSVRLKSPLSVGKYFEFYLQDKTYGCTWKNTINEPYEDDKMRLQLSNRGGQFTVFLVTGDGEKIKMRADGINCKGK